MNSNNEEINELYIILSKIEDPRKKRGIRYKLCDLILLLIYGVLAGMKEGVEVEFYVQEHFEYFKKLIGLKSVPSHDTFSRILRMLDFENLATVLGEWLNTYYPEQIKYFNDMKVLHIDGKAVKAAAKKSEGEKPVYLMNAQYEGGSISLYTNKIGDKENEMSYIPKFLENFNIKDTIVTIDAIGCNKVTIDYITKKGWKFCNTSKRKSKKVIQCYKR